MQAASCCEKGSIHIYWCKANPNGVEPEGPTADGWAMAVGARCEAYNQVFENIQYCPFCGKELKESPCVS